MPSPLRYAALAGVALGLAYWLGAVTPNPSASPGGVRLGPESGEMVQAYLDAAAKSVAAVPPSALRWALVSPATEWTPQQVWDRLAGAPGVERIGRVLIRVPIPGVAVPTVTVPVGQSAEGVRAADEIAALMLPSMVAPGERGAAVARVAAGRLRAGRPAVVGAVVWGTGESLRAVAAQSGVRAVDAAPDSGRGFALAPLLPSFGERAEPGVDDAPVPSA